MPFYKVGAEAELKGVSFEGAPALSKKRVKKGYRVKALDDCIRKTRAKSEAKLLKEASAVVNTPKIFRLGLEDSEIVMEFIGGVPLKQAIGKNPLLCVEAGKCIRRLHDAGIIHGDLTTSNIIFLKKPNDPELAARVGQKGPLFFIDFGLGFFSKKLEDRATDLVVFKKTFNATHSGIKNGWALVMEGYAPTADLSARMAAIEKRARYH